MCITYFPKGSRKRRKSSYLNRKVRDRDSEKAFQSRKPMEDILCRLHLSLFYGKLRRFILGGNPTTTTAGF
jgi:hypothetical protein